MKKRRIIWRNVIVVFIFVVSIITLTISITKIIKWNNDNSKISDQVKKIDEIVEIKEVIDTEDTEVVEQTTPPPETNPYWDYIKMNMIDVNFSELKKLNNQVKGWIQVNGTNINYPFVQAKDNKYYLTRSFDKSYNQAGWVFLDYRNNVKIFDKNTIIYAHSRLDKTMFGSLKNILKNSWYKNTSNHIIKLSTEAENTLWQVFSVYHIETTSDYLQTTFVDSEYKEFLDMLINRSMLKFNTTISEKDKILTLSTCYSDSEKMVMHAKLIKYEKRKQ